MSLIQTPWTSQPQQAVGIDWSNPLARTITHCFPLNGDNRELVTGASLTLSNGIYGVDSKGKSLRGSGTNACASVPLNLSAFTKLTVSFWMYWDAFANDDKLAMEYGSNFVTNAGFFIDPNSSGVGFEAGVGSVGAANSWKCTRPSSAEWHHYFIVFDRTTGSARSTTIYIDAIPQSHTVSGTAANVADNFGNNSLYLFSRNNASLFGAGRMQNLVFRCGYLGNELEAREEYRNPWQIFRPLPRRIFAPVATGGGTTAVTADHDASYTIAGSVAADASAAYAIRAAAQADQAAAYAIRAAVASDLASSYAIQSAGTVSTGLDATYAVRGAVAGDISVGYQIAAAVQAEVAAAYAVRAAVQKDLAAGYAIDAGVSSVAATLSAAYAINGVLPSYPSAESIAAAVLALAQVTPIHVDIRKVKGQTVTGSGTSGDPWGP